MKPEHTTFDTLINDQELLEALKKQGIHTPTLIQSLAIPPALSGRDVVAQAQTGSGKTMAFMLPILSQLKYTSPKDGTLALVLAPTREIGLQIHQVVHSLAPQFESPCIIGGRLSRQNIQELRRDPRIVIGTPGRMLDFIQQGEIDLRDCRHFVLDEADEMLGIGFLKDVTAILSKIPRPRQGMLFSATITPRVQSLARSFLTEPQSVVAPSETESAPEIEHFFCRVDGAVTSKITALCSILEAEKPESCLIFCNTKSDTELVEVLLQRKNVKAKRLNSDLSQSQREKIMAEFRSGEITTLIATDIAARGIDVKDLELAINYAIHDQPEIYVHRTGRTGRAGKPGRAISLVGPQDFTAFYALTKQLSIELKEVTPDTLAA